MSHLFVGENMDKRGIGTNISSCTWVESRNFLLTVPSVNLRVSPILSEVSGGIASSLEAKS